MPSLVKIFEGSGAEIEQAINAWLAAQPDTVTTYQPEITAAATPGGVMIVALIPYDEQQPIEAPAP